MLERVALNIISASLLGNLSSDWRQYHVLIRAVYDTVFYFSIKYALICLEKQFLVFFLTGFTVVYLV